MTCTISSTETTNNNTYNFCIFIDKQKVHSNVIFFLYLTYSKIFLLSNTVKRASWLEAENFLSPGSVTD